MEWLNYVLPVVSLILGYLMSFFVQKRLKKDSDLIEQKRLVYLDFLSLLGGAYSFKMGKTHNKEIINKYYIVLNKMYLIASYNLIKVLEDNSFIITQDNKKNFLPDSGEGLKLVIRAMRKDLGYKADFDFKIVCMHDTED